MSCCDDKSKVSLYISKVAFTATRVPPVIASAAERNANPKESYPNLSPSSAQRKTEVS